MEAERDEAKSEHNHQRTKRALKLALERLAGASIARSDLRRKLRVELRPHFDPAISELVNDGLAERVSLDNGEAYRGVRND